MGLADFLPALGGVESILGLFGANSAAQQALQQRQQAISNYGTAMNSMYGNMLGNNQRALAALTGQYGDDLRNLGSQFGSSLANAGVYNSSAVGGALANALQGREASLQGLGQSNFQNAQGFYNQGMENLAGLQLGAANTDVGHAWQQQGNAAGGLASFLGSLGQYGTMFGGGARNSPSSSDTSSPTWQGGQVPGAIPGSASPFGFPGAGQALQTPGLSYSTQSQMPRSPLTSMLGTQGQAALGQSGANAQRMAVPLMNGTQNQGMRLPGNLYGQNPLLMPSLRNPAMFGR